MKIPHLVSLLLLFFCASKSIAQPANDDCANAIVITPNVSPNCTYTSGTFSGAVLGTIPCETGSHQDIWYQFTATEEVMRVYLGPTTYLDHGFQIIEGSCTGTSIACVDNNSTSYSESYTSDQFTIGTTYFVRVYNSSTNASTLGVNICVESYPPPSNEDCADAITLTPNVAPNCTYTSGTFYGSSYSTIPCETGNHQDVWYQFTATEEVMRVTLGATSYLDHGFEVIEGSCTGTSMACVDNNSSSYSESYVSDQFTVGTTYFVRVYNSSTGLSSLNFNICVESYPPPSNEDCADAITLTPNVAPNCTYTSGTFYGSSYSTIPCETGNHQDVWYQFTATEEVMRVTLGATSYLDHGFEIIEGSCTGTSIACVDNNSSSYSESYVSDQFTVGTTYFVRVYNSSTSLSSLNFNICVESYPPPSNEDCADAITLTPNVAPNCTYTSGTFYGSSYSTIPCETGNHQDVWYQFTATEEVMRVSLGATSYLDHGFEIIEGSCTGTSIACVDNNSSSYSESYVSDQFTVGTTYFVRVYNSSTSLSSLNFNICVESYPPPSNEDCADAITLTPNVAPNCTYTSGTFYGSSYSTIPCETGNHQDVWYQFTATTATHKITLGATSYLDHGFEVIEGSCTGTSVMCVDNNGSSYSETNTSGSYVIGNTYFIRVFNSSTSLSSLNFNICIESYPVSVNDDCTDAITLMPNLAPNCTYTTGTFSGAALGTIPCETGNHQDVWYQFTATEEVMRVTLGATSYLDHGFEIIEGSCTGTSIACVDNNSSSYSESYVSDQFTIGTTYFVRVYNSSTNLSSLDFNICVESYPPPANEDCADAITLTPNVAPNCTYTSGTFYGSSFSTIPCETGNHQDVWYQFTATEEVMRVSLGSTTYLDHGFEIIEGNCTGTSMTCVDNNGSSYSESYVSDQFTIGTTYFVRVYNSSTSLSSLDFNICVESYPPPANEDCADAITLTPNVSPNCTYTTGTFSGSTYSTIPCETGNHQDVWYQFTATTTTHKITLGATTYLDAGFEVIEGSCTGASVMCVDNNGSSYGETNTSSSYVVGNTYFVRVYNSSTSLSSLDFNICIESFPVSANDDCSDAVAITPSISPACNTVASSFSGAVLGTIPCEGGDHQDVWFQFVATEELNRIFLSSESGLDHGFEVIDGSCTGASLSCVDNNGTNFSESYTDDQYVVGNTYFIRVFNSNSNLSSQDFEICVESFPPPANNDCADAISLTANQTCTYTSGSFSGASQSTTSCETGTHQDVWYAFTATNDTMNVALDAVNDLDLGFEVLDACNGTSLNCTNDNGPSFSEQAEITNLTMGNEYFVRVYHTNGSFLTSTFDICVFGEDQQGAGLNDWGDEAKLSIYPNPSSSGLFTIHSSEEINEVIVYDVMQRVVLNQSILKEETLIDLSAMSSGVYYVKCVSNKGEAVRTVVKN